MVGTPASCTVSPVEPRSSCMTLRISPTVVLSPLPPTILGSSDSTTSASVPSSDRSLPRMISLVSTVLDQRVVFRRRSAASPGTPARAACPPPAAAGPRTAKSGRARCRPAARSVTRSRSFSIDSRAIKFLPSTTTSTSNSVEGKRLVTSSYCRNSLVSERNSWLSESSTLMRSRPSAAMTHSTARMMADTTGARSGIRPSRSRP